MTGQASVQFPVYAAIIAHPKARRVNPHVNCPRLVGATRLNYPDVHKLLATGFRELNALSRLMPRLTKVIAIAQERPEEITIIGSEHAMPLALIEYGIVDAASRERSRLDLPLLAIL